MFQNYLPESKFTSFMPFAGLMMVLDNLVYSIDVRQAHASVEADRIRILKEIEEGAGAAALNAMAIGAMNSAQYAVDQPAVLSAAFGDSTALDKLHKRKALDEALPLRVCMHQRLAAAAGVVGRVESRRRLQRDLPLAHLGLGDIVRSHRVQQDADVFGGLIARVQSPSALLRDDEPLCHA